MTLLRAAAVLVLLLLVGPLALDRSAEIWSRARSALADDADLQGEARVTVASPAVYSRERLLNDRFEQVAWLSSMLSGTETLPDRLAQAKPQEAPAEAASGKPGESTATDGLRRGRRLEQVPGARENFELTNSFRDVLRAERAREMLDDGHDMDAGTLHLLSFDTTVAARAGARGFTAVEVVLSRDETAVPPRMPGREAAIRRLEELRMQDALDLYVLWMRRVQDSLTGSVRVVTEELERVLEVPQEPKVPDLMRSLERDACIVLVARPWEKDAADLKDRYAAARPACEEEQAGRFLSIREFMREGRTRQATEADREAAREAFRAIERTAWPFANFLATRRILREAKGIAATLAAYKRIEPELDIALDSPGEAGDLFLQRFPLGPPGCDGGLAPLSPAGESLVATLRRTIDLNLLRAADAPGGSDPGFDRALLDGSSLFLEGTTTDPETGQLLLDCRTRLDQLTPTRRAQLWLAFIRAATELPDPSPGRDRSRDFTHTATGRPELRIPGEQFDIDRFAPTHWLSCMAAYYLHRRFAEPELGDEAYFGGGLERYFAIELERSTDGTCALRAHPRIVALQAGTAVPTRYRQRRPEPMHAEVVAEPEAPACREGEQVCRRLIQVSTKGAGDFDDLLFVEKPQADGQRRIAVSRDSPLAVRLSRAGAEGQTRLVLVEDAQRRPEGGTLTLRLRWLGPERLDDYCAGGCTVTRDEDGTLLLLLLSQLEGPGYSERPPRPTIRATTYALTPRLRQAFSRTESVSGGVPARLLGMDLPFSDTRDLRRSGLEPEVVGFTRSREDERLQLARFGWLILPPPQVEGPGVWTGVAQQAQLGAIVAMPSWWRSALATVCHGFTGGATAAVMQEAFWQRKGIDCHAEVVRLPGSANDVSRRLGVEVITYPFLNPALKDGASPQSRENIVPSVLVGQEARILLRGERLWRSTVVTLDAQTAERIEVLPDMTGIIAHFACVAPPTATIKGDPAAAPQQEAPGTTLPDWVRRPPAQGAPAAQKAADAPPGTGGRAGDEATGRQPPSWVRVRLIVWTSESSRDFEAYVAYPANYDPTSRPCPPKGKAPPATAQPEPHAADQAMGGDPGLMPAVSPGRQGQRGTPP